MNNTEHWLTPDWPAPSNVHAATTQRTGGVSSGTFNSLNLAAHVGDETSDVLANRKRIETWLKLPSQPLWLEQVHGNRVVHAQAFAQPPRADASYTDQAGTVLAVLTADCLPLLACSTDGLQVAAIHAGWRGLLAGVISNTLSIFPKQETLVWLGPAIGADCFEVGPEVRSAFVDKSAEFTSAFKAHDHGKWLADIYRLASIELASLGISQVFGGDFCTVTEQRRFFSYRRDQQTGRMATLIWRD